MGNHGAEVVGMERAPVSLEQSVEAMLEKVSCSSLVATNRPWLMCHFRLTARQERTFLGLFSRLMILSVNGDGTGLGVVEYGCFREAVTNH